MPLKVIGWRMESVGRKKIRSFGYFCLKYTTRVSEQPVCPYVLEISRLVQKIKKIVGEVKVSWIGKVSEYLKHAYAHW